MITSDDGYIYIQYAGNNVASEGLDPSDPQFMDWSMTQGTKFPGDDEIDNIEYDDKYIILRTEYTIKEVKEHKITLQEIFDNEIHNTPFEVTTVTGCKCGFMHRGGFIVLGETFNVKDVV